MKSVERDVDPAGAQATAKRAETQAKKHTQRLKVSERGVSDENE
jgi:hypothetical protein